MKKLFVISLVLLLVVALSVGCSKTEPTISGVNSVESKVDNEGIVINFVNELPTNPIKSSESDYDYDDMAVKQSISMLVQGWDNGTLPQGDLDPIKKYIDEKYNVDFTLALAPPGELDNMATLAVSDGKPYDIIWGSRVTAKKLLTEDLLIDAKEILQYAPTMQQYVTKDFSKWASSGDFMMGIPRYPTFPQVQNYFIRTDWLEQFGMEMPKTTDELLEFARKVAKNDPDGNGKDDTYFAGAGDEGRTFGNLSLLEGMFGAPNFTVTDGTIAHSILNGTKKEYLKFLNSLVSENLLIPDWYTVQWGAFTGYVSNLQLGITAYPMGQTFAKEVAKAETIGNLDKFAPLKPVGSSQKVMISKIPSAIFLFSYALENNESKIKRIAHMLDSMIYPNEDFFNITLGGVPLIWNDFAGATEKFPGYKDSLNFTMNLDGTFNEIYDTAKHPVWVDQSLIQLYNYSNIGYTTLYKKPLDPIAIRGFEWDQEVLTYDTYTDYSLILDLDSANVSTALSISNEWEIAFVNGTKSFDDWDAYVALWLSNGGQKMLDDAAEQLGVKKIQ